MAGPVAEPAADETADATNEDRERRVVVVGGGFAGARVADQLTRRLGSDWSVYLLSRENYLTYNPLLAEVVGASIAPVHAVAPLRQIAPRARHMMVRVTGIDTDDRRVHFDGERSGSLAYDHLVLAVGSDAKLDLVPGMGATALPLKTLGDALHLRNRVMARLEAADVETDPERRRWLTTFVVIGGGFSGVETAGEMGDFLRSATRHYPRVDWKACRVILLHKGERLLPEMPPRLGLAAQRRMCKDMIDLRLNARVSEITDEGARYRTADGETHWLPAGTVVCTIGTQPNPLLAGLPAEQQRGRIATDEHFRVPGLDGVWAVGDCAAVPCVDGEIAPPTAQCADRAARILARNIAGEIAGTGSPCSFDYRSAGMLSTVGHHNAVAEIHGVPIWGLPAFLAWRMVYLMKIPTLARKSRIFLEWTWDLFFSQDIVHLGFGRTPRPQAPPPATGTSEPNAS